MARRKTPSAAPEPRPPRAEPQDDEALDPIVLDAVRVDAVPLHSVPVDAVPVDDDLVPDVVPDAPEIADAIEGEESGVADASRALVRTGGRGLPAPYDPLARYIQEVRRFPEIDRDEEQRLARVYRATHDPDAARRLITAHLMLVVKLALMYRRAIRNVMDLIQEGNVGLLEALKRFDPDQGVRFPTYAAWWIKAYMLKFLLDNARLVRVGTTNARRKLLYNLRRERERLEREGIAVTTKLLAERFDVPENDVVEVERAMRGADLSVDTPISDDGSITIGDTLSAPLPSAEEVVSTEEIRERVAAALAEFRSGLGEREQAILDARLVSDEPQTLQELGDRFGVTREAMRQAENKLKERLGRFLRERLGDEVVLQFGG